MDTDASGAEQAPASATAAPSREEARYPLAFDLNGNPIQVPPQAVAWRVRRGGGRRGRPRNVFDATTGRQLEIALGASIEDLMETNVPADRYLLYPVDGQGSIIPGIVAVTEVTDGDDDDDDGEMRRDDAGIASPRQRDPVGALQDTIKSLEEVVKAQSEHLSRALGQAVSGYGTIRPVAPPLAQAPQIVMEPAAPPSAPGPEAGGLITSIMNMKPEQMMQIGIFVKQMLDMIKGAGGAVGGGP